MLARPMWKNRVKTAITSAHATQRSFVIAHGKGDPDVAVRIALALGEALEALPGTEHSLYSHLIDNALSDVAKEKIKMMPEPPQVLQRDVPPLLGAGCRQG